MRKKIGKYILVGIMSVALGTSLIACGKSDSTEATTEATEITTEATEEENTTEEVSQTTESTEEEEVTVYTGNDNADALDEEKVTVNGVTPENLITALAKNKVLPETVKVLKFEDKGDNLILDLSGEYQDYIFTAGDAGEQMSVGSIVNTFLDAYDATYVTILIEGEGWASGHVEYEGPLTRYTFN